MCSGNQIYSVIVGESFRDVCAEEVPGTSRGYTPPFDIWKRWRRNEGFSFSCGTGREGSHRRGPTKVGRTLDHRVGLLVSGLSHESGRCIGQDTRVYEILSR